MVSWAYIAGYFDGEGHVSLHTQTTRRTKSTGLTWYNTHLASLEAMQAFMGCGHIYSRMAPGRTRRIYQLVVGRRAELLRVGVEMFPHLIVKRGAVADLLVHVRIHVRAPHPGAGKVAALGVAEIARLYHDEGLRPGVIAERLNVSADSVRHILRSNGVPLRQRAGVCGPKSAEIRARMTASRRALWANPAFRERQAELRTLRSATLTAPNA